MKKFAAACLFTLIAVGCGQPAPQPTTPSGPPPVSADTPDPAGEMTNEATPPAADAPAGDKPATDAAAPAADAPAADKPANP